MTIAGGGEGEREVWGKKEKTKGGTEIRILVPEERALTSPLKGRSLSGGSP